MHVNFRVPKRMIGQAGVKYSRRKVENCKHYAFNFRKLHLYKLTARIGGSRICSGRITFVLCISIMQYIVSANNMHCINIMI